MWYNIKDKIREWRANRLFKLLDIAKLEDKNDERIEKWLASNWQDVGFRQFISVRDAKFLKELSGGMGMVGRDRVGYTQGLGQRFELLYLGLRSKQAYERLMKKQVKNKT